MDNIMGEGRDGKFRRENSGGKIQEGVLREGKLRVGELRREC